MSCCIFNTLRSCITSSLWSISPYPTTTSLPFYPTVYPFVKHVQATSVYPVECSLPSCMQFTLLYAVSMFTNPRRSFNLSEDFLASSVTIHINHSITSFLFSFAKSSSFTVQFSHMPGKCYHLCTVKIPWEVSKGKSSRNLFQPHLILATMLSSRQLD